MRTRWPSLTNRHVWNWEPLPGIDPSLGETAFWAASAAYAATKEQGLSESLAQQEAEKTAFQVQYGVSYSSQLTRKQQQTK
jgi:hypothetical protein